jgi:hypothetical protein
MKRSALFVVVVLVCMLSPFYGYAQGIPGIVSGISPFPGFSGSGPPAGYSSCGGNAGCEVWGLTVVPSIRAGFGRIGYNFNLPIPRQAGNITFDIDHLDLKLDDANLWLGNVMLDLMVTPDLVVFGEAWATPGRLARSTMIEDPIRAVATPVEWDSSLEWWQLGFGAAYRIKGPAFVAGGLKFEHLSVNLTDPRAGVGDLVPIFATRLEGDLRTKLTMPYVGFVVIGSNCRGGILYSPFAWASVDVPINSLLILPIPDQRLFVGLDAVEYSFKRAGVYVEAFCDYRIRPVSGFNMGVWAGGSYLKFRGSGDESLVIGAGDFHRSLQGSGTATLTRSIIAAGLSVGVMF